MLDDIVRCGACSGHGTGDEARVICYRCARVGDLHGAAVGDSLEEAQEGDFMGGKSRCGGRRAADARDVDGSAGQGGEDEAVGK